jgi:hypothetical protein
MITLVQSHSRRAHLHEAIRTRWPRASISVADSLSLVEHAAFVLEQAAAAASDGWACRIEDDAASVSGPLELDDLAESAPEDAVFLALSSRPGATEGWSRTRRPAMLGWMVRLEAAPGLASFLWEWSTLARLPCCAQCGDPPIRRHHLITAVYEWLAEGESAAYEHGPTLLTHPDAETSIWRPR